MGKIAGLLVCVSLVSIAACNSGTPAEPARTAPAEPTSDNEVPFGNVDGPAANGTVTPTFAVTGWALDDQGIDAVRIFIDNRYRTSTRLSMDRPDVAKAYPNYARSSNQHGWTTTVTIDQPGPHVVLAQAVDTKGQTRDIGVVAVTVKQ